MRTRLLEGNIDNYNDAYKFCQTINIEVPKKEMDPESTFRNATQTKTIMEMAGNCYAKIYMNFLQSVPKKCKKWSTDYIKKEMMED